MVFNLKKSVESITTKRELSTPMEWSLFRRSIAGLPKGGTGQIFDLKPDVETH